MRLVSCIEDPDVIIKVLTHLGLPTDLPRPAPARDSLQQSPYPNGDCAAPRDSSRANITPISSCFARSTVSLGCGTKSCNHANDSTFGYLITAMPSYPVFPGSSPFPVIAIKISDEGKVRKPGGGGVPLSTARAANRLELSLFSSIKTRGVKAE